MLNSPGLCCSQSAGKFLQCLGLVRCFFFLFFLLSLPLRLRDKLPVAAGRRTSRLWRRRRRRRRRQGMARRRARSSMSGNRTAAQMRILPLRWLVGEQQNGFAGVWRRASFFLSSRANLATQDSERPITTRVGFFFYYIVFLFSLFLL